MKTHLLMAVAAAMLVSSCSKNEIGDSMESTKSPIGFSTYVGTTTKATDLMDADFLEFQTSAYLLATDYVSGSVGTASFETLKVTRTNVSTAWAAIEKAWPTDDGKLNFFAFAPSTGSSVIPTYDATAITSGAPTLTYTPGTDVAKQSDVVVAHSMDVTSISNAGKVKLSFKHALTKIQFAVTTDATSKLKYKITKIEVTNVLPTGIFTFATDVTSTGVGIWATNGSQVAYTYFEEALADIENPDQVDILGTNGSLMLIPQDATAVMVNVTYSTVDENNAELEASHTKSVTLTGTWAPGQNLRYNLKLSTVAKNITFETDALPDWETETSPDITPAP